MQHACLACEGKRDCLLQSLSRDCTLRRRMHPTTCPQDFHQVDYRIALRVFETFGEPQPSLTKIQANDDSECERDSTTMFGNIS
jgi:hypothetical protein